MKLKRLNVLLVSIYVFVASVYSQSDKTEGLFNETFGLGNSQILDSIIDKAENMLEEVYNVRGFDSAANSFLSDLVNTEGYVFQKNLDKEKLNAIDSLFNQDSLKYKIWDITNCGGKECFELKFEGIYLKTFDKLKDESEIAYKYCEAYNIAGAVSHELLVSAVLDEEKENLNDFLMKRIIVVDFFYSYALSLIK